jgi:membrane-associated HD superfamily phosphohydrolase
VKEGVDLALKYKLNQRIIDIIQEHHGTSLVRYFYQRALQQHEDARAGGKIMKLREGRYSAGKGRKFSLRRTEATDERERHRKPG